MDEHVLVVGAGGFMGQHLVRALKGRGEKVVAVTRHPTQHLPSDADTITAELTEARHFAPLLARCRAVIYLASRSTPGSTAGRPVDEVQGNLLPLAALLQALQVTPRVELLYLSSGGCLYTSTLGTPATETAPIHPSSYHGAAKVAAEYLVTAWCAQFGSRATLLRPSNVYGPGQVERTGFGVIPTCFGKIVRGEHMTVWGDGSAVRDYLYIDDFVQLCLAILHGPMPEATRVINASSGKGTSLNELFLAIEKVTGRKLIRNYELHRLVDSPGMVMDSTAAQNHYGWMPKTTLEEGLQKTWDWFNNTQH